MGVRRAVAVMVCVGIGAGCKPSQPPAPKVVPPTQQEAEAFVKELVAHSAPCDASWIDDHIDFEMLAARVVAASKIPKVPSEQLRRNMGGQRWCNDLKRGSLAHLRIQNVDGTPQPLLRVLYQEGALNYLRLELDKRTGPVRIADFYDYSRGEALSETLRGVLATMVRVLDDGKLSNTANFASKGQRFRALVDAGEHAEALSLLRELPRELRDTKQIRGLEIVSLGALDDDRAYLDAITAFERAFPDDPSLALIQLDGLFLRKEHAKLLEALDKLDRHLGGDPYLDARRALALLELGKHAEAIAAARRVTTREPALEGGWWALLTSQAAAKDFASAVATLAVLRDRFSAATDAESLRADERFGALAQSAEYSAWSKQH